MRIVSDAPPETKAAPKYSLNNGVRPMTDSERQEKVIFNYCFIFVFIHSRLS